MTHDPSGKLLELAADFTTWDTPTLVAQCRMQARENLDPEYTRFMEEVAARLSTPSPDLKADNAALVEALRVASDAINEMFRYFDGGETRGSYDGKPERAQLRKAGYAVRAALQAAESRP